MGTPSRYEEHPPLPPLAPFVECLWTRTTAPGASIRPHRVLPDGCLDILLTMGAGGATATAVGAMTRPLAVRPSPGDAFVGVRFRPGRAVAFLGVAAEALTDARVPLDLLRPDVARLLAAADADPRRRVAAVAEALRPLAGHPTAPPPAVTAALAFIAERRGRIPVDTLCERLGVTRQHLARQFARHVGVSPKTFCRVARVQHVIRRTAGVRTVDWDRLAVEAGYYDQSHLISDFGELVGATPTRWLAGA